GGRRPAVLEGESLQLAVARGAAYFGLARRGLGVRIGGGAARTYYLGLGDGRALCLVPRGMEEGEQREITEPEFELLANRPVSFPLLTATDRSGERAGEIVAAGGLAALPARAGAGALARARGALVEPRRLPPPSRLRRCRRRAAREPPLARARRRVAPCARRAVPGRVVESLEAHRGRPRGAPAGAPPPAGEPRAPPPRQAEGAAAGRAGAARDVAGGRELRASPRRGARGPGRGARRRGGARARDRAGAVGAGAARRACAALRPAQLRGRARHGGGVG